MSDTHNDSPAVGRGEAERHVGHLIRSAGPRSSVPADVEERLFRAAHAEWRQSVRAKRRARLV